MASAAHDEVAAIGGFCRCRPHIGTVGARHGVVVAVGATEITFADYGVVVPNGGPVISVDDFGVLELQFLLTQAATG